MLNDALLHRTNGVKSPDDAPRIDRGRVPRHLAVIMDGNGRWAAARGLPRVQGHQAGVKALRETVRACCEFGVEILTVFAFSTENWERPAEEVEFLMRLLEDGLSSEVDDLHAQGVRVQMLGDREGLPSGILDQIDATMRLTGNNDRLLLNIALNYGGRAEILAAAREIARRVDEGYLRPEDVDERTFAGLLFTGDQPDPDLIIRTGGERRLSNFLLWQLAYAELWVTDLFWPDFRRAHLVDAFADFQSRNRRFGRV